MPLEERSEVMREILQVAISKERELEDALALIEKQREGLDKLVQENKKLLAENINQHRLLTKLTRTVIPEMKQNILGLERKIKILEREKETLVKEAGLLNLIGVFDDEISSGDMESQDE